MHPALRLGDSDFSIACGLRLGLRLHPLIASKSCVCGEEQDPYGEHALRCVSAAGGRIRRHDTLVAAWAHVIRTTGRTVTAEVSLYKLGIVAVEDARKRMDLVGVDPLTYWDVVATHPGGCRENVSSRNPGSAAEAAARGKHRTYDAPAKSSGAKVVPLACETFGCWAKEAVETVKLAAAQAGHRSTNLGDRPLPKSVFIGRYWAELGVALQRGNAALIRGRAMAGLDRHTAGHRRTTFLAGEDALLSVEGA